MSNSSEVDRATLLCNKRRWLGS